MTRSPAVRLTAWVEGRVQGVGFRWWVRSRALELGLTGYAENLADGRVKVVAEGPAAGCEGLLARLDGTGEPSRGLVAEPVSGAGARPGLPPGPPGRVRRVSHRTGAATGEFAGFTER